MTLPSETGRKWLHFEKNNTLGNGGCMGWNFAPMITERFFMIGHYIWGFNATISYSLEWHWKVIYNMPGWSSIRTQENLWTGGVFCSPSGLLVSNCDTMSCSPVVCVVCSPPGELVACAWIIKGPRPNGSLVFVVLFRVLSGVGG